MGGLPPVRAHSLTNLPKRSEMPQNCCSKPNLTETIFSPFSGTPVEWNYPQERGRTLMAIATRAQITSREEQLAQVQHSLAMEDVEMTPQGEADAQEYVEGRITIDELIRRGRTRHGLG